MGKLVKSNIGGVNAVLKTSHASFKVTCAVRTNANTIYVTRARGLPLLRLPYTLGQIVIDTSVGALSRTVIGGARYPAVVSLGSGRPGWIR